MSVNISVRHCELDSSDKQHLEVRFGDLLRRFPAVTEAEVVITREKWCYVVEAVVRTKRRIFKAESRGFDLYSLSFEVCDRLHRSLSRFFKRIRCAKSDKHRLSVSQLEWALADMQFE